MTSKIFLQLIELGDSDSSIVRWFFIDPKLENNQFNTKMGSFNDFLKAYESIAVEKNLKKNKSSLELIGLISCAKASFLYLKAPTKNKKQALQALPFMVEENIIGDIEGVSIAAKFEKNDQIKVAIIDKIYLEQWINLAQQNNFVFSKIISLSDVLSPDAGVVEIIFLEECFLIKSQDFCFEIDAENFNQVFNALSLSGQNKIHIYCNSKNTDHLKAANRIKLEKESDGLLGVDISTLSDNVFHQYILEKQRLPSDCVDFLSENLSNTSSTIFNSRFMFFSTAIIASLAIMLFCLNISSGYFFKNKSERFLLAAERHYLRLFPDEEITDLNAQWAQKMSRESVVLQNVSFSFLFSSLIEVVKSISEDPKDFELFNFRYDMEDGALRVSALIPTIAMLDDIKKKSEERGVKIEILSANDESGNIKASFKVGLL